MIGDFPIQFSLQHVCRVEYRAWEVYGFCHQKCHVLHGVGHVIKGGHSVLCQMEGVGWGL